MPGRGLRGDGAAMSEIEIRDARGGELVAGCELLATSLGFAPRDALPPWLIQTTTAAGGIALAAFADAALVGISIAVPAEPDALFSCGLAVDPAHRGHGVGRRLKLAQRQRALASGRTVIRWTAEPLAAGPLALYLSGLGARLVGYETGLYDAVRPSAMPEDDVTIEWRISGTPPATGASAASVEVPFDHRALEPDERLEWRMRVRNAMVRAVDRGTLGTAVAIDRAARRAWVQFSEARA
jgi:predicted GNAT superfamily acetyltransferase